MSSSTSSSSIPHLPLTHIINIFQIHWLLSIPIATTNAASISCLNNYNNVLTHHSPTNLYSSLIHSQPPSSRGVLKNARSLYYSLGWNISVVPQCPWGKVIRSLTCFVYHVHLRPLPTLPFHTPTPSLSWMVPSHPADLWEAAPRCSPTFHVSLELCKYWEKERDRGNLLLLFIE